MFPSVFASSVSVASSSSVEGGSWSASPSPSTSSFPSSSLLLALPVPWNGTAPRMAAFIIPPVLAAGYYYYSTASARITPKVDPNQQTAVLPDGSRTAAYHGDKPLLERMYDDAGTVHDTYARGRRLNPKGPMLGARKPRPDGSAPFEWITYDETFEAAAAFATGLASVGAVVGPGDNSFVGIFSRNRPEWIITELAAYTLNNAIVPLYETLGQAEMIYVCKLTGMALIVCDTPKKALSLVKAKAELPALKHVVIFESDGKDSKAMTELRAAGSTLGVGISTFDDLIAVGKAPEAVKPVTPLPKPSDLATICFTSGTTGNPKGALLTHGNIVGATTALMNLSSFQLGTEDVYLSFLPLAHMFERVLEACVFGSGACIGYYRGDIKLLADDIKTLRPTILAVVPRVLNKIYDKVMLEASKSPVKMTLLNAAIAYKRLELSRFVVRNDSLADSIVFKKIRESLGGRVRLMVTGSAPLSTVVLSFLRAALGCIVVEGYGQTENAAAATLSIDGDANAGHVGIPLPGCRIKLVDVPDMEYYANKNGGEICIKGPIVFQGYYKNPEETAKTLDADGWLHTGDIGTWTPEGTLKIVDRKKHIFKLAQGEYVFPEKVENVYARSRFVAQIFVHGESLKTCLIAVVVPDPETLLPHLEKRLGKKLTLEEAVNLPEVKADILADMCAFGRKDKLLGFEQVKEIYITAEAFTIENDLLTPTMKTKRPQVKKYFAKILADMYSRLD